MSAPEYLTCMEVFRRLDDYVDRELSDAELRQVEDHLRSCAVCAREARFEERLLLAVRAKLQRIALPPGIEARVWKSLRDAAREPEDPRRH